jgi:hypothetical protein
MAFVAYHGSPWRFDQFDLAYVGTGEGFQTYGVGVYLAEKPEGARAYSNGHLLLLDGRPFGTASNRISSTGNKLFDNMVRMHRGDMRALLAWIADYDREPPYAVEEADFRALEPLARSFLGRFTFKPSAYLYTVGVDAHSEQIIDLDRPATEQPPEVRNVLGPAVSRMNAWFRQKAPAELAGAALRKCRKAGSPLEPLLAASGYRGFSYCFPERAARDYVIFNPDHLAVTSVNAEELLQ